MSLPDFFVVGAGRSGTTSLDRYLRQHPAVFLPPVKAPSYFFASALERSADSSQSLVTPAYFVHDRDAYERLYDSSAGCVAGDVSPVYLASVDVAPRIAAEVPEAKIVAILRDPIERAQARFVARRRDGLERRATLRDVLDDESRDPLPRDTAFATTIASGFAGHYLRTYVDRFPAEQIRVYLFEDLARDANGLMRDLFEFLGVDPTLAVDTTQRHNASRGTIANPVLRSAWTATSVARAAIRPYVPRPIRDAVFTAVTRKTTPVPLDPGLRSDLAELYRADVALLEELTGRDLSHWLRHGAVT